MAAIHTDWSISDATIQYESYIFDDTMATLLHYISYGTGIQSDNDRLVLSGHRKVNEQVNE